MTLEYEPCEGTEEGLGTVADVYVVRDTSARATPSAEFLAAVRRLSPAAQAIVKQLVTVGFQALVRR